MMLVPRRNSSFDLFDDFFREDDFFNRKSLNLMKTDIKEKADRYVIEVDIPGCEKEDVNLSLNNGYLEIVAKLSKEDNSEEYGKYIRQERFFGECSRSFYVGDAITEKDIDAEFKNGILKIEVPKKDDQKEKESRRIEIR